VLKELSRFVKDIIVICNFEHIENGIENVDPYATKVICRKNIGYDSGAFRDFLLDYMSREELSKYGEIFAVQEDSLVGEDLDGNEIDEPVKMFYIDTDLGKFMRLKLDFNCVSTEDNAYVLLPMINYEEKRKMMEIRAGK
jgi:hypothetical protein